MSYRVIDCEQRTPDWYQARLGKLTGSCAADMLATIKSGEAAARRDLRLRLVCERLTMRSQEDTYVNAAMQRGIDMEPAARAAYEVLTGQIVQECGFLQHATLEAGCSLDGYVGDVETLVSLKCPKSATHLGYLRAGVMPAAYVPQMLHELWITGARRYDFLSFDDRMPDGLQVFWISLDRNDAQITEYEQKALAFLDEVANEVECVRTLANLKGQMAAAVTA